MLGGGSGALHQRGRTLYHGAMSFTQLHTRLLLSLSLVLTLGACRSASYQTVPSADLAAPVDGARVVLLREGGIAWGRFPLVVYEGTTELARLAPGRFFSWDRPAGRFVGRLVMERPQWEGGPVERVYDVQLADGETHYIRVGIDLTSASPETERLEREVAVEALAGADPVSVR